jgi:HlyD family secretion protein
VGLNAAVDVSAGRAEGAVLVPVEALRELSPGEYAIFVMEVGEPKLRTVEVGLMDFTMAEITSGLEPGEIVWPPSEIKKSVSSSRRTTCCHARRR